MQLFYRVVYAINFHFYQTILYIVAHCMAATGSYLKRNPILHLTVLHFTNPRFFITNKNKRHILPSLASSLCHRLHFWRGLRSQRGFRRVTVRRLFPMGLEGMGIFVDSKRDRLWRRARRRRGWGDESLLVRQWASRRRLDGAMQWRGFTRLAWRWWWHQIWRWGGAGNGRGGEGRGVDAMNEKRPGTGSKKNEEKKMCNMGWDVSCWMLKSIAQKNRVGPQYTYVWAR